MDRYSDGKVVDRYIGISMGLTKTQRLQKSEIFIMLFQMKRSSKSRKILKRGGVYSLWRFEHI